MQTAAELRQRANRLVEQGRFNEAAALFRQEAGKRRQMGDYNAAEVVEALAGRYQSEIVLYAHLPDKQPVSTARLGKYEPLYGCYTGAFIDRDDSLTEKVMFDSRWHGDPREFQKRTGKKPATVFTYVLYGREFPTQWVQHLQPMRVAPHIAFEPNQGLDQVENDAYLTEFAKTAGAIGTPMFLRYASEMNGNWTRYGGNPALYKEKWKIVADAFRRHAKNVALIWCVNHSPEKTIEDYYPGDDFVDWVGINFYSVPFYDNNPNRVGIYDNPVDRIKYAYNLHADKKPVAICEFSASRQAKGEPGVDRSEWAARKIADLYAALPRVFERVKMINVYDCNNLLHAPDDRRYNNFSVTDSPTVLKAYSEAVKPDYFLETVGSTKRATPIVYLDEREARTVKRGILRLSSWARCHSDRFLVRYRVNGQPIATVAAPGPREVEANLDTPGPVKITGEVLDNEGKVRARREYTITVI
jgi:hypothetical protein